MDDEFEKRVDEVGEFADEEAGEQDIEALAAAKLKEVDFGPFLKAVTNEEPDANAEAALKSFLAETALEVMKKATVVKRRKQMNRLGAAAIIIAAKS
ncbi:MAG: hypothetical protein M1125_01315 [Candidatus Marsarchaeota archaeon]|nr:hypothetical protein [Candidatus Marsarchaeota archaeon]